MKSFVFKKLYIFLFVSFIFGFAFFLSAQSDGTNPPSALNYAPNFQFDIDEKYYPADPLDFYFENGEEIEGERAVNKYNQLSLEAKLNNFTVLYHIEDEGNHWVYQYWTFYVFNDNPVSVKNKHYSDWEAVFVFVDKETKEVIRTIGTAHHRKTFDTEIENPKTNHIWAYVANGSHAICVDEEGDEVCNFSKWRNWEKWDKNGYKTLHGGYKLKEITQEYISQFNGATTLTKSPILGIDWLSLAGFSESENKEADNNFAVIELGGNPPNYPWAQSMYNNPEEARPYSVKYAGDKIKEAGSGIAGFFGGLADKVGDLFKKSAPLQPAGIGGVLVDNPVFEIEDNLVVVSVEEEDAPVQVQEKPAVIVIPAPVVIEKVEEKPVEVVDISLKEPIVVEKEIEETKEDEIISQPDIPYGFSPPIGGGAPSEPDPESEPESEPEPESDPDPESEPESDPDPNPDPEPASVPAPAITSHSSGDILGAVDDYSTSTPGFQINLIGTSSPDFLVSISLASTMATTTADGLGDWNCVIDLSEGENNLAVKAIDGDNNESEETLLNLIVDTTPPSDISDLSANSGDARGTVVLSWTAPGDSIAVFEYIIRYSTSSEITDINWASSTEITNELIPSIASSTENLLITSLTPSEIYYWAIKSEDDAGNTSGLSNCASSSPSAIAENIVISEISVQGSNCTTDDFIELYNPTDSDIYLGNYQGSYLHLVKRTKTGTSDISIKSWNGDLEAKVSAHGFYLWANSNYTGINITPDATTTAIISANNGIALRLGLKDTGSIIDSLGWGDYQNEFVEGNTAIALSVEQSLERQAFTTSTAELLAANGAHHWKGNNIDRNDNSQDFVLQTVPNPQNSFSLTEPDTVFPVLADTDWPMLQGDIRHSGLSSYTGTVTTTAMGAPTSTPKWTIDLESGSSSSPIIGLNGEIYIGAGSGKLYKVDPVTETAELFYSVQTNMTIQTPAIALDGTIYISDNQHYFYALSSEGKLKWKYNILNGSSPTIGSDGVIYVGSSDGLHAINPNGERIWQNPDLSNGKWVSSPVLDSDGTIYTVGELGSTNVYALNPQDGNIIWQTNSMPYFTAPSLTNEGLILVGGYMSGYSRGLYAINSLDSGNQEWYAKIGNIIGSIAAIGQNAVYVGTLNHNLYALNKTDDTIFWSYNTGGEIHASPIIDAEGIIYIGSQSGMFYALNPADGSVKWQAELNGAIGSSAVINSNGIVYIASNNGTLYAFGE